MNTVRDRRRLRGERWEAASFLAFMPCTNAQELIFGPDDELKRTIDVARTTLIRFPSEQLVLENTLAMGSIAAPDASKSLGVVPSLIVRFTRASAWLFGNARLMNCELLSALP